LRIVNMEEMADILRISIPTLKRLMKRYPDFPVVARGSNGVPWQFDADAVIAFVRARREAEAAASAERDADLAQISLPLEEAVPPEERALSASDRLKNAQAMLKEDEVARQRGFLVLTSEMRQRLAPAWAELGQSLQAMPATLGRRHNLPDAVVRDMRAMIAAKQREIHATLQDLLGGPPPPGEPEDAAAA
jgi:phage terminase Nu1 subunit (DNA packaging protein)